MVDRTRAIGEYEGTLRDLIHAFKYGGRQSIAQPLATRMCSCGAELLDDGGCIVPVPLHWRREYRRGFNQALELARYLGLPIVNALVRRRHTQPQVELAADRRYDNVEGAFALRHQRFGKVPAIAGLKIILVDDVSTTGATLEACAKVLKQAGASQVYALTAARVITRHRAF
jgi:ComF family protein